MSSPEPRSLDEITRGVAVSHSSRRSHGPLWLVGLLFLTGCAIPVTGLRAEHPELRRRPVTVDSLEPTLRWESFPRPRDRETVRTRARDVTYELRIWEAADEFEVVNVQPVYSRRGLKEPSHRVEEALKPGTRYLWTVRAWFELEGHPRVTQWAARAGRVVRGMWWGPFEIAFYGYAFKTPSVRTDERRERGDP